MMATTNKKRSPTIRLTAQERRDGIVDAAMHEFALGGFDGTAAAVIALRAGVSQPYPFALSAGEAEDALNGVRTALLPLLRDRTLLLLRQHAFAACEDLGIRAITRAEFETTRRPLAPAPGGPDRLLRSLLAQQAMLSMAAAMDLPEAWS